MNETAQHNCGQCDGETLMSYIYGETDGAAAARVEDHLLECADCRSEFADLSESRLSVFEWNKLEFEPLATPAINIEYAKDRGAFAAFVEAVAGKWRIAVPAFAAFVIAVSGFAVYSGIFSNGAELAKDQPKPAALPAKKPNAVRILEKTAAEPQVAETEPAFEHSIEASEKAHAVTVSDHPAAKRSRPRRAVVPVQNEPAPSAMTVADVPVRLSDFEEAEDDSPRLSDLFDETETS